MYHPQDRTFSSSPSRGWLIKNDCRSMRVLQVDRGLPMKLRLGQGVTRVTDTESC